MKVLPVWILIGLLVLLVGCSTPSDAPPTTPDLEAGVWNSIETGGDTACADSSAYAFFALPGKVNKLIIDFRGGGACWNYATCSRPSRPGQTGGTYFNQVFGPPNGLDGVNRGIYDHDNATNPFNDWYHVHVPYCTGDIHYGDKVTTYSDPNGLEPDVTIHHKGAVNSRAVLDWIFGAFEAPETIFVTGCSAGAYGSVLWTPYLKQHYPNAEVHQLGDCGAGIVTPGFVQDAVANWNTEGALPDFVPGLDPDTNDLFNVDFTQTLYRRIAEFYPSTILSQYNTVLDGVQINYYSLMKGQEPKEVGLEWSERMRASLAAIRADTPNFSSFTDDLDRDDNLFNGTQHCAIIYDDFYTAEQNGVRLVDWVSSLLSGATPEPVSMQ